MTIKIERTPNSSEYLLNETKIGFIITNHYLYQIT